MLIEFQPRRRARHRGEHPAPPPAPPPPLHVTDVAVDHGYDFNWTIYWEFDGDLPAGIALADLAGLKVDGVGPASIEDGGTNWLMLLFPADQGVGAAWDVVPGGSPIFAVGEAGTVGEI